MPPSNSIDIPVASVTKGLTVQVNLTGFRRWHLRLRLGVLLMRLAIWVSGMGCEVEGPTGDEANDERYGSDEHLTDLGKETIGTLREMRARNDPRLRCYSVIARGRCRRDKGPLCPHV